MKPYLLSLGAGLLVGIVYGLLNVRSPAPPVKTTSACGCIAVLLRGAQWPSWALNIVFA